MNHCLSIKGVGDSRRRGTTKKERERLAPVAAELAKMAKVWAVRMEVGLSAMLDYVLGMFTVFLK